MGNIGDTVKNIWAVKSHNSQKHILRIACKRDINTKDWVYFFIRGGGDTILDARITNGKHS